jgi:hypothetical protein
LSRYFTLLLGGEGLPDKAVSEFADLMRDLKLTPEDVANDRKIIEQAVDLADNHDQQKKAITAIAPARQARNSMRKRHQRESMQAENAIRAAEGHAAVCNNAAHKLNILARQRPEFFTTGETPPRLLPVSAPLTTDSEQPVDNDISE